MGRHDLLRGFQERAYHRSAEVAGQYRFMKFPPIRLSTALCVTSLLGIFLVSCFGSASWTPAEGYHSFQTAVARAPKDGYTVYWLGRSFTAGGLTFTGPEVSGTEAGGLPGGGVDFSYNPPGSGAGLNISLLSDAAWQRARGRVERTPGSAGWQTKQVMFLGRPAVLQWASAGTRPLDVLALILTLGDTHIVAGTSATGPLTPGGPDTNPLIDEQTFLSIMQQLRRYSQ